MISKQYKAKIMNAKTYVRKISTESASMDRYIKRKGMPNI